MADLGYVENERRVPKASKLVVVQISAVQLGLRLGMKVWREVQPRPVVVRAV